MTINVFFIPGNHLYPPQHLQAYRACPIVMIEDMAMCRRYPYHQQKLGLLLAGMREYAQTLRDLGFNLHYFELDTNTSLEAGIREVCAAHNAVKLSSFAISDSSLSARLNRICANNQLTWVHTADPGFLTSQAEFDTWASTRKTLQMGHFYKHQRQTLNVLLADNKPVGGKWSFDAENRHKLPAHQSVPAVPGATHSALTTATLEEIRKTFADHPGNAMELWLPTTRAGAQTWLQNFLTERFIGFGTYEDAITQRSATLFHSTLSPLINLGLITPDEVLWSVEKYATRYDVPLNDREGFIRQLIGWREFLRGVYHRCGPAKRSVNKRNHQRELTHHWHTGDTGIPPLDDAIRHQQQLGWTHHINRLMIVANLMNLCEIRPDTVYDYFMTYYVDAYDWVMVPNVYGMGITSNHETFATKPYVCGSNYMLKMSDFSKGPWCDVVDGLYWRFVSNNRTEFSQNPRSNFTLKQLDKMDPLRSEKIFSAAEQFLERCTLTN